MTHEHEVTAWALRVVRVAAEKRDDPEVDLGQALAAAAAIEPEGADSYALIAALSALLAQAAEIIGQAQGVTALDVIDSWALQTDLADAEDAALGPEEP